MLREQGVHDLHDLLPQVLEACQLMHLDLHDDASELLIDQLDALEGGRLQSIDLLLREDLEGDFRHEKIGSQRASIANSSLYVVVCQRVKRVDVADRLRVVLVEDVVEARAALQLRVSVLDEASLEELRVVCRVLSDDIKHELLLGLLAILADLEAAQLFLLLVEHRRDLGANDRQTLLDVLDDDHVESASEVGGAHARRKRSVRAARLEVVFFGSQRFTDRLSGLDVLLGAADHADVAKLKRVDLALDDVDTVGALVHQINLGQNTNCAIALWVDSSSEFEGVRVGQVLVRRRDRHDN